MLSALCSAFLVLALPLFVQGTPVLQPTPRPLVIWHGLGDSHSSAGMLEFMGLIKDVHPGIFIHSVYIEENLDRDQRAGVYGNLHKQLELVSNQLAGLDELQGGFDAMGFSQGGQFMRAYVEQYNDPPVNNLITFGSQHMGIADLPLCKPGDIPCQLTRNAARSRVYTTWAQENIVQAQYFRDTDRLAKYYEYNTFLTSINNELAVSRNQTYFDNLVSLSNLVLVLFSEDTTVVPKESSWFGSYAPPPTVASSEPSNDGVEPLSTVDLPWDEKKEIIPMRLHPIYTEDWIGLRTLDRSDRLILETCEGLHMRLSDDCWRPLVKRYVGELVEASEGRKDVLRVQAF